MRSIEVSAKTRKDAIQQALDKLGVELHEVNIEILDEGSRGIFGLGARNVKVRVTAEGLPDLPAKPVERPAERSEPRGRRPERSDRPERPDHPQNRERSPKPDRPDQSARGPRPERPPRQERPDQPARGPRPERQDRPERRDRPQPARDDRRDRPQHPDRRPSADRPAAARQGRDRSQQQSESQRRADETPRKEVVRVPAPPIDEETRKLNEHTGTEAAALLQNMITLMGLEATVSSEAGLDGGISLNVQSPDSAILIGRKGRNLSAMQYLINRMSLSADNSDTVERLTVDIEGYLDRRRANLEEMAQRMAQKVKDTGKEVRLQPLNPQERRMVHLVLQDDPDVRTFSLGNAAFRSVVIAPKNAPQKAADDRPRRSRGGSRRGGGRRSGHNGGRGRQDNGVPQPESGGSVEGAVQES